MKNLLLDIGFCFAKRVDRSNEGRTPSCFLLRAGQLRSVADRRGRARQHPTTHHALTSAARCIASGFRSTHIQRKAAGNAYRLKFHISFILCNSSNNSISYPDYSVKHPRRAGQKNQSTWIEHPAGAQRVNDAV